MREYLTILLALIINCATAQYKMSTQEYIEKYKNIAIEQMKQYKIPASIKLAQGIIESGSGGSRLAVEANNHFGIKCKSNWTGGKIYHDDDEKGECFRKYRSATDSYSDHSIFLSTTSRYAALFELQINDYKGWAYGLKSAGYATSPTYASKLIKTIEDYELYKFDNNKIREDKTRQLEDEGIAESTNKSGREWGKNNGIKYVIAKKGDTFSEIADQEKISIHKLLLYNDLSEPIPINAGTALYIQAKRNQSFVADRHTVEYGETTHSISQKYAITLDALKQMNPKLKRKAPEVGQRIKLSK